MLQEVWGSLRGCTSAGSRPGKKSFPTQVTSKTVLSYGCTSLKDNKIQSTEASFEAIPSHPKDCQVPAEGESSVPEPASSIPTRNASAATGL